MVDKMTTHLEELHGIAWNVEAQEASTLRDMFQQSKVKTVSLKLNRTRHKLLKIQSRMDAAEVKIANLTTEMSKERFFGPRKEQLTGHNELGRLKGVLQEHGGCLPFP